MADGIQDLDENAPIGSQPLSVVDDDLRDIKGALQKSFTHVGANSGVVTASAAELNHTAGLTSDFQSQIDAKSVDVWTFPLPDDVSGLTETWVLQPNTQIMPRFSAGGTIIKCELPLKSAASDGDAIQIRPRELDLAPGVSFQLSAPGAESYRLMVDHANWQSAMSANFNVPAWPHVLIIFSTALDAWQVRPLNRLVDQYS